MKYPKVGEWVHFEPLGEEVTAMPSDENCGSGKIKCFGRDKADGGIDRNLCALYHSSHTNIEQGCASRLNNGVYVMYITTHQLSDCQTHPLSLII